jgi:tetratricopeptide (TPR) repeat protein
VGLTTNQARRFVAKKEYDEAIAAFQEILRHYPEEKEPYSQIIWIANLTGQTEIAENFFEEIPRAL